MSTTQTTATVHRLNPSGLENRYNEQGKLGSKLHGGVRLIVAESAWAPGFGVGYIDATGECCREHGGPVMPGPYAYGYGIAGVVDQRGGTGAEIAAEETAGVLVRCHIGDVVEFPDGVQFRVEFNRHGSFVDRHNIVLVPVD